MSAHHCSLYDADVPASARPIGEIRLDPLLGVSESWRAMLDRDDLSGVLAERGSRVLVLAAGPMIAAARAFATLREESQWGATDAMPADEPRIWRDWDRVVALTRTGTERELLHALRHLPPRIPRTVVTAAPAPILFAIVDQVIQLPAPTAGSDVAFETTHLLGVRAALGADLRDAAGDADRVLASDVPLATPGIDHFAFVGSGWTTQLAARAANAMAAVRGVRAEAHALRDVRYGALDHVDSSSLVWFLGGASLEDLDTAAALGAVVARGHRNPLVDYLAMHRMVLELQCSRPPVRTSGERMAGQSKLSA